jgi:hypothetical protein
MTRIGRRNIAWVCLSALLYLQLAVAAYACSTQTDVGPSMSTNLASVAQPCQGMDQEHPKLCEQHCIQASQSVDTQPHSTVNTPVLPLIAVVDQPDLHLPIRPSVDQALLVKAVDPPPLVRFGVLRI